MRHSLPQSMHHQPPTRSQHTQTPLVLALKIGILVKIQVVDSLGKVSGQPLPQPLLSGVNVDCDVAFARWGADIILFCGHYMAVLTVLQALTFCIFFLSDLDF